jgi:hypothetical protein
MKGFEPARAPAPLQAVETIYHFNFKKALPRTFFASLASQSRPNRLDNPRAASVSSPFLHKLRSCEKRFDKSTQR